MSRIFMETRGRPTKVNPKLQDEFCGWIQRGATLSYAADQVGVTIQTVARWRRRGAAEEARIAQGSAPRAREAPYLAFTAALRDAVANAAPRG